MNLKKNIKRIFFERAPNTLLPSHVTNEFPDISLEEIEILLDELVKEGFLDSKVYPNQKFQGISQKGYSLKNLGDYPIRFHNEILGLKIPRMIDGGVARGEDINEIVLQIKKVIDKTSLELKNII